MSTDHVPASDVEEATTPVLNPTTEFFLIMVITGVVALGGVAFLTI